MIGAIFIMVDSIVVMTEPLMHSTKDINSSWKAGNSNVRGVYQASIAPVEALGIMQGLLSNRKQLATYAWETSAKGVVEPVVHHAAGTVVKILVDDASQRNIAMFAAL